MRCVSLAPLVGHHAQDVPRIETGIWCKAGIAPPYVFLKLIFKLFCQIFDVVRRPVLYIHAKVQTHT